MTRRDRFLLAACAAVVIFGSIGLLLWAALGTGGRAMSAAAPRVERS
jgi:hypothetical protein